MPRVRVHVSGHVQGVFFRDSTRRRAVDLGLAGWVRNLADGRVEAVFEGPADALEAMVAWCWRGPALARVDAVEVERGEADEGFADFRILPTAGSSPARP